MEETIIQILARELERPEQHVRNIIALLDEGNTVPFIARYRKELHGGMDDQLIRQLAERLQYLRNLQQRRDEVRQSIENQGKLTDELSAAIDAAATLAEVEDLYRPYKQKRRTRATMSFTLLSLIPFQRMISLLETPGYFLAIDQRFSPFLTV